MERRFTAVARRHLISAAVKSVLTQVLTIAYRGALLQHVSVGNGIDLCFILQQGNWAEGCDVKHCFMLRFKCHFFSSFT